MVTAGIDFVDSRQASPQERLFQVIEITEVDVLAPSRRRDDRAFPSFEAWE